MSNTIEGIKANLSTFAEIGWKLFALAAVIALSYVVLWGDARYADRTTTEKNDAQSLLVRQNHEQRLMQLETAVQTLQGISKEINVTLAEGKAQRMALTANVQQLLQEMQLLRMAVERNNDKFTEHLLNSEPKGK